MAGVNGAGKSTLAARAGALTRAVVIDHDTSKSALLGAGIPHPPAGNASYETIFAFAADLLRQGHAVIIDSPSVYREVPERGLKIAAEAGVPYFFVECICPVELADERLRSRRRRPSQVDGPQLAAELRRDPQRAPHRPATGTLSIDTAASDVDAISEQVVAYLQGPGATGPVIATSA